MLGDHVTKALAAGQEPIVFDRRRPALGVERVLGELAVLGDPLRAAAGRDDVPDVAGQPGVRVNRDRLLRPVVMSHEAAETVYAVTGPWR